MSLRTKCIKAPKGLNNHWGSSGFWGIRPQDYSEACLLWGIFRSNLIQKQLIHLASGYTQRELNDGGIEVNIGIQ